MLTHFAFSYKKTFRSFKLNNMKKKFINLDHDNIEMFRHNFEIGFDVLLRI